MGRGATNEDVCSDYEGFLLASISRLGDVYITERTYARDRTTSEISASEGRRRFKDEPREDETNR
jgi:hypothetical protein